MSYIFYHILRAVRFRAMPGIARYCPPNSRNVFRADVTIARCCPENRLIFPESSLFVTIKCVFTQYLFRFCYVFNVNIKIENNL